MSTPLPVLQSSSPAYSSAIGRALDNTALASFLRCPKLYEYSMLRHMRSKGATSPALAYGTAWHKGLEVSYKAPKMPREDLVELVHAAIERAWEEHRDPSDYRTLDRCKREYVKYLDQYGLPWEEPGETVGWLQGQPLVEIATELTWEANAEKNLEAAFHPYAGKLDRIVKVSGQLLIEDHKTSSQFGSSFFNQFQQKNQMIGYAFLAQLITGLPIAGVRINAHICRKTGSQNERQTLSFSQEFLRDWANNYNELARRVDEATRRWLASNREDTRAFPHNYDACDTKYGMCSYAVVCSMPERLRLPTLEHYFHYHPWNPMEADDE